MFDSGPIDVLDKLDDHIAQKPWFHSCKKEPVNLVDFFVKRNSRERLALFRDENEWQQRCILGDSPIGRHGVYGRARSPGRQFIR